MSRILDELVNHTKSFLGRKDVLTWSFAKGSYTQLYRSLMVEDIERVDDRLTGIRFKRVRGKADLIINHGELPSGASAAAFWDANGWEIRQPAGGSFSTTAFRHELGHVLGLGHVPMGTNSIMQPNWGGVYDFTKRDWRALESVWS